MPTAAPKSIARVVAERQAVTILRSAMMGAGLAIALLLGAAPIFAQSFDVPFLCPEDGECSAPGAALYDLSSFDIPFQVEWPNPPNITRTIYVPGEMSLTAATAISGAHIIVAAGSYPGITISRADQWFELDDNAVLTGTVTVSTGQERTKISGGQINGERFQIAGGALDFLVDNMRIVVSSSVNPGLGISPSNRVAFLNTTIRAGSYGLYIDSRVLNNNFIFANMDIVGGLTGPQAATRLMSMHNMVFVDSRIKDEPSGGSNYTMRLHGDVENVYVGNNQLEPSDAGNTIWVNSKADYYQADITYVYIRNNRAYRTLTGFHGETEIKATGGLEIRNVWVENNTLFLNPANTTNYGWLVLESGDGTPVRNLIETNNIRVDYTGTPTFTGGADH